MSHSARWRKICIGAAWPASKLVAVKVGALKAGEPVNLEVDVLAKYVERLLAPRAGGTA